VLIAPEADVFFWVAANSGGRAGRAVIARPPIIVMAWLTVKGGPIHVSAPRSFLTSPPPIPRVRFHRVPQLLQTCRYPRRPVGVLVIGRVAAKPQAQLASAPEGLPKPLSRIRQLKGLFCGLPGSPGQNSLAVISADALAALDQAIGEVATRAGADVIVYKEFSTEDLPRMDRLVEFGYRRIPTQPMHFLKPAFPDFAHYCAALSSNYRKSVQRSTRKLQPAGAEVKVFTDSDEILRVYTPEVHALYYQMVGKAEVNIELLPTEFFRQLTSRLKGHVELVTIIKEARIIAIGWCLNVGSAFHLMYAGLDYQLNRELDLYFNLMYAALDRALRSGAAKIHVGQTASAFKARLGCHAESLYGYIKGRGLLMWPLVRIGADLVLSQMPTSPPADIFRKECGK
jgi:hypothetical protein